MRSARFEVKTNFKNENMSTEKTILENGQPALSKTAVSGSLRVAAQKLLDAVSKHHPQMSMDTQLDLYMAYHEVKDALSNDR